MVGHLQESHLLALASPRWLLTILPMLALNLYVKVQWLGLQALLYTQLSLTLIMCVQGQPLTLNLISRTYSEGEK